MISEKKFSSSYTSFWDSLAPMLTPYVNKVNRDWTERFARSVPFLEPEADRGLTNEVAFKLFEYHSLGDKVNFNKAVLEVRKRLERIDPEVKEAKFSKHEAIHILSNFKEFSAFINECPSEMIFHPKLNGCGLLRFCEGDLQFGNSICEVKAGDRNFRGVDFRQILTYAALKYFQDDSCFTYLYLLNPRRGVFFKEKLDLITYAISGLTHIDFFNRMRKFLEGTEISK